MTRSIRSVVAVAAAVLLPLGGVSTAATASATASPASASTHRHLVRALPRQPLQGLCRLASAQALCSTPTSTSNYSPT